MQLETQRTLLRPFTVSDLEDFYAYASQPGVGEMAGWRHHTDLETSRQVLDTHIQTPDLCAVVYRETGRVIGHIGVKEDSENHREDTRELGFALHQGYQRMGIMTEVVRAVMDYLARAGIKRVYACCFQENLASGRLIEGCGFVLEGEGTFHSQSLDKNFSSYEYRFDFP